LPRCLIVLCLGWLVTITVPALAAPRDVFAYVIHEGKIRAPAAAMALIERIGR